MESVDMDSSIASPDDLDLRKASVNNGDSYSEEILVSLPDNLVEEVCYDIHDFHGRFI